MGIYLLKKYCYQLLVAIICALFGWHLVKQRKLHRQIMSAIVLIPFLLRLLLIK